MRAHLCRVDREEMILIRQQRDGFLQQPGDKSHHCAGEVYGTNLSKLKREAGMLWRRCRAMLISRIGKAMCKQVHGMPSIKIQLK